MHLEHRLYYTATGCHYESRPNPWVVIDDYGTEHDDMGNFDVPYHERLYVKRTALTWSAEQDPDFFRFRNSRTHWYRIDESMSFSSPIGLSIEVGLRIRFLVHPRWDEQAGDAYYEREHGARLEILEQSAHLGEDAASPVTLAAAEVEEFCWQYIELQRARERAEAIRTTAAAQARRSS